MQPYELKTLIETVRLDIQTNGFHQADRRLDRKTMTLLGYRLPIDDGNLVRWLKSEKVPSKFVADWDRMKKAFDLRVADAKLDPDSRRLLMLNLASIEVPEQCFTQMQFVRDYSNEENKYALIVTQRSGDMSKFTEDLIFFGSIAHKWEKALKTKVRRIIVNYAHIHYQL